LSFWEFEACKLDGFYVPTNEEGIEVHPISSFGLSPQLIPDIDDTYRELIQRFFFTDLIDQKRVLPAGKFSGLTSIGSS
jgi:hypothetical protein